MTKHLTSLSLLATTLLPLAACNFSLAGDSEGNFSASVEIGKLSAASAESDAASQALPPIEELKLLGYQVSSDFHDNGAIALGVLALDANGEAILDSRLYLEAEVSCDVSFPMGGWIQVGASHPADQSRPFRMAVDLDGSGSMASSDPSAQRIPASHMLIDVIDQSFPGSTFAAWEFNDEVVPLVGFTSDTSTVKAALSTVGSDGSTRLHDSVKEILDALSTTPTPGAQPAILLLSDGLDTASDADRDDVIYQAQSLGVPIYAVGLGGALDIPGLDFLGDLQVYSYYTGGMFTYIDHAGALEQAFEAMALGMTHGYQEITLVLQGGLYLPFSTCQVDLAARAGGQESHASFEFVVPLG